MLRAVLRNYRSKKKDTLKKALFITFHEPISRKNYKKCCDNLNRLLKENYDSYIFQINDPQTFTAHAIKLLLSFCKTASNQPGLVCRELKDLITPLNFETLFTTGTSEREVLLKMEAE